MIEHESNWQQCNSETFWREVASCSHVVQLYEDDDILLSMLEDFVVGGVSVDDCVIVIGTSEHLTKLSARLTDHGLNLDELLDKNQYLPIDANKLLSKFMVDDLPDKVLFITAIMEVFDRVRNCGRQVRAFGEMVAILWSQNLCEATVMLEHLWNDFFETETFSLFCAYPKALFPDESNHLLSDICKAHSKMITNSGDNRFDLSYHDIKTTK